MPAQSMIARWYRVLNLALGERERENGIEAVNGHSYPDFGLNKHRPVIENRTRTAVFILGLLDFILLALSESVDINGILYRRR